MSSGAKASEELNKLTHEMRVRRSGVDKSELVKFVKFKVGPELIEVDEDCKLRVKDLENEPDIYQKISSLLVETDCCYALYDCTYMTTETKKEDLIFIHWAPTGAPIQQKMLYSASKSALNNCLHGIKIQMQMNDEMEKDKSSVVEKLQANGCKVTEIEGVPLRG